MPKLPRVVIPHTPHHVTQRGNRRQQTFFNDGDYQFYLDTLRHTCHKYNVKIWAYCLMPNHVHLIAVPDAEVSLRYAIGDAHEIYSKFINRRNGWRGYFWQGRFFSVPMDPAYTLTCARYIECNPVRGKLCDNPFDYQWSSARAHLSNTNDLLVEVRPMLDQVGNWADFLNVVDTQEIYESIRLNSRTGRPLGTECFMKKLEHATGLHLIKKNGGKRPPLPSTLRD